MMLTDIITTISQNLKEKSLLLTIQRKNITGTNLDIKITI